MGLGGNVPVNTSMGYVCKGLTNESAVIADRIVNVGRLDAREIVSIASGYTKHGLPQPDREPGTTNLTVVSRDKSGQLVHSEIFLRTEEGITTGTVIIMTAEGKVLPYKGRIKRLENGIPTQFDGFFSDQKNSIRVEKANGIPIKDIDLGDIIEVEIEKGTLPLSHWRASANITIEGAEIIDHINEQVHTLPFSMSPLNTIDLTGIETRDFIDLNANGANRDYGLFY